MSSKAGCSGRSRAADEPSHAPRPRDALHAIDQHISAWIYQAGFAGQRENWRKLPEAIY